jgi:hypothetical protein
VYGLAASLVIGVGHLVSSIAMVAVFFYAKSYLDLTRVNEPIELFGSVSLGGPVSVVAGVLLVLLGVREYRYGHSHGRDGDGRGRGNGHEDGHAHGNASHTGVPTDVEYPDPDPGHGHDHGHGRDRPDGLLARLGGFLPFVGSHSHPHSHTDPDEAADRGLLGIAWSAFLLGFAHEEEFEIIALCAGSDYCLELMSAYALTVIGGIVGLTLLLVAGYEHHEEQVERYTPYLPAFSAAVLTVMGIGFVAGVL